MATLNQTNIQIHLDQLKGSWTLDSQGHLFIEIKCKNFMDALDKANQIAPLAETMNHHPDLLIQWGKLSITLWTHDASGLTQKDFNLAHEIEKNIFNNS